VNPGLYDSIPDAEYHDGLGVGERPLSSTLAKALLFESPAEAIYGIQHRRDTEAFAFGRLVHELTLEGEVRTFFDTGLEYRRGNDWAEVCKVAAEAGRTPVTSRQMADAQAIASAVHAHPVARDLLSVGRPEVSAFAHDVEHGIDLQARFDWLRDPEGEWPVVVDLKTTAGTANPRAFNRSIGTFRYHLQGAFYRRVYELVAGKVPAFVWVVVSKEPPHAVSVIRLSDKDADTGLSLVNKAAETYARCLAEQRWPGHESIYTSSLPVWADFEAEEVTA